DSHEADRWWRNSAPLINAALPNSCFDQLGVPRLAAYPQLFGPPGADPHAGRCGRVPGNHPGPMPMSALVLLLPLVVGHAVDERACARVGYGVAALFRLGAVPLGETVATKSGEVHQVDVLNVRAFAQMPN